MTSIEGVVDDINQVQLVKAIWQDRDLLYEWTNEEAVRQNSINTQKIEYQDHVDWFFNKLNVEDCDIFIYYVDKTPVGQIRVDYKEEYGWISFSIDYLYRGQGHGGAILKLVEEKVKISRPNTKGLKGIVKSDNIPSQKKFEELNYDIIENKVDNTLIIYKKNLNK